MRKISLFLVCCLLFTAILAQVSNPKVKYDKFSGLTGRPTRPAVDHKDVAYKDGNPPFVFIGVDPKLTQKIKLDAQKANAPKEGTPVGECVNCPCKPRTVPVEVVCEKIVNKYKYVPYYLYYSRHAVITGDRAAYLSKLIYKIRILRKTNAHFRLVLRQLVLKKKINKELYKKADEIAIRKKKELERAIVSKKVSIEKIEKDMAKFKKIMKKLGYEIEKPTVCKTIVGKRVCGLKEKKYSKKLGGRVYKQNKLFTRVYYVLRRSKIISLSKKKDMVIATRRSKQWVKRTVKVNQILRTNIANIAYAQQYRYRKIYNYIQKTLKRMEKSGRKKLRKYLKSTTGRRMIIRKIIEKKYGKKLRNTIRGLLKSKVVKDLQKNQYKPVVTENVYPTRVTKIAVKLPKAVLSLASKDLIKLLELKARSKK
jgi:hypothetical protein